MKDIVDRFIDVIERSVNSNWGCYHFCQIALKAYPWHWDVKIYTWHWDVKVYTWHWKSINAAMSMIDDISRQRYMPYCWNFGRGIFWFLGYVHCNRVIFDFLIRWKCIDGFSLTPSNKQLLNTQGYFNMIVMNCWILSHFCESKNQKKLDWEVDLNFDSIISSNFQLLTECLHW